MQIMFSGNPPIFTKTTGNPSKTLTDVFQLDAPDSFTRAPQVKFGDAPTVWKTGDRPDPTILEYIDTVFGNAPWITDSLKADFANLYKDMLEGQPRTSPEAILAEAGEGKTEAETKAALEGELEESIDLLSLKRDLPLLKLATLLAVSKDLSKVEERLALLLDSPGNGAAGSEEDRAIFQRWEALGKRIGSTAEA